MTTNETAIQTAAATVDESALAKTLTLEYAAAVGKSVKNVLALADILIRAKKELQASYKAWLVANRLDEGKASKYRSIGACPQFRLPEVQAQLQPSFTVMYQLSKIARHEGFTPEVANEKFMETLKWLNTPTVKGWFPNLDDVTLHVSRTLGRVGRPGQTAHETEAQEEEPGVTDEAFEDDGDVQILIAVQEAFKRLQIIKGIKRVLAEAGVEAQVILAPKVPKAATDPVVEIAPKPKKSTAKTQATMPKAA